MIDLVLISIWFAIPFALIYRKMGRSGWWSLLGLIPLGFIALAWMAAFMRLRRGPTIEQTSEIFR